MSVTMAFQVLSFNDLLRAKCLFRAGRVGSRMCVELQCLTSDEAQPTSEGKWDVSRLIIRASPKATLRARPPSLHASPERT